MAVKPLPRGGGGNRPETHRFESPGAACIIEPILSGIGLPARERFVEALRQTLYRSVQYSPPSSEQVCMSLHAAPDGFIRLETRVYRLFPDGSFAMLSLSDGEERRLHAARSGLALLYAPFALAGTAVRPLCRLPDGTHLDSRGKRVVHTEGDRIGGFTSMLRGALQQLKAGLCEMASLSWLYPFARRTYGNGLFAAPAITDALVERTENIVLACADLEWEEAVVLPELAHRRAVMESLGTWTPGQRGLRKDALLSRMKGQGPPSLWVVESRYPQKGEPLTVEPVFGEGFLALPGGGGFQVPGDRSRFGEIHGGQFCLGRLPDPAGGWPVLSDDEAGRKAWELYQEETDMERVVAEALSNGILESQDMRRGMGPSAEGLAGEPWL